MTGAGFYEDRRPSSPPNQQDSVNVRK